MSIRNKNRNKISLLFLISNTVHCKINCTRLGLIYSSVATAECNDGNAWSFFPLRSREILPFSPRRVKRSQMEKKAAKNDDSFSLATNMLNNPLEDLGNLAKIW